MQQAEIINILEDVAPPIFAASWDKSGIQVASSRADIGHMAVSLDPTPDAVMQALDAGADMLLTHHPLTMAPRYPDRLDAYHAILRLLFSHNILLYAAHTSLDANPCGPAAWLPDALGLQGRCLLEPTATRHFPDGSMLEGGMGCVGDLPEPLSLAALTTRMRDLLPMARTNAVSRLIGTPPSAIHRVGLCTGSGSSLLDEARRLGAELFITGDVKYHTALDLMVENRMLETTYAPTPDALPNITFRPASSPASFAVLDVGHFTLEEEMIRCMALVMAERLPGVRVTFLPSRDPFLPYSLSSEVPEVLS